MGRLEKVRRLVDEALLERRRGEPCAICATPPPSDPAHVRSRGAGGPDAAFNVVPLCRRHHREQHQHGWPFMVLRYDAARIWLEREGWGPLGAPLESEAIGGLMIDARQRFIEVARFYIGVHEEGGDNRGPMVERFQKAVNPHPNGEPWCAAFVCFCIKETERQTGVKSNMARSEGCLDIWNRTPPLLRRTKPEPGFVVIWKRAGKTEGHIGIVVGIRSPEAFFTVEGNTTKGHEIEREGDGVYLKERTIQGTQLFLPLGFIAPF